MKKSILLLLVALIAAGALISCGGGAETVDDPPERRDLPQFFLNPPQADDVIYGLGMAKLSDDSLSRDTAVARARRDIAFQVSATVQSMLTDYAQEAGSGDSTQTLSFVESVT